MPTGNNHIFSLPILSPSYHTIHPFKLYNLTVLLYSQSYVSITIITFRTFQYAPPPKSGILQLSSPNKSPFPQSQGINFVSLQICLFWTFCINGVKQYMAFCYWHLQVSNIFSSLLHVSIPLSFSFLNYSPLYQYTTFYLSIHQLMDIEVVSIFWLL